MRWPVRGLNTNSLFYYREFVRPIILLGIVSILIVLILFFRIKRDSIDNKKRLLFMDLLLSYTIIFFIINFLENLYLYYPIGSIGIKVSGIYSVSTMLFFLFLLKNFLIFLLFILIFKKYRILRANFKNDIIKDKVNIPIFKGICRYSSISSVALIVYNFIFFLAGIAYVNGFAKLDLYIRLYSDFSRLKVDLRDCILMLLFITIIILSRIFLLGIEALRDKKEKLNLIREYKILDRIYIGGFLVFILATVLSIKNYFAIPVIGLNLSTQRGYFLKLLYGARIEFAFSIIIALSMATFYGILRKNLKDEQLFIEKNLTIFRKLADSSLFLLLTKLIYYCVIFSLQVKSYKPLILEGNHEKIGQVAFITLIDSRVYVCIILAVFMNLLYSAFKREMEVNKIG